MISLDLRNEFIFPPIKLGYSDQTGVVKQQHLEFYGLRSKHIGAVTIEPLYMDSGLREIPTQLGIDSNDKISGLRNLTNLIHKNGSKAIAHLNHPGRLANPKITGNYFWSSTDKPCENGGAVPEYMNRDMMDRIIDLFVSSAKRAVEAGFDIIELQFGHGYLLAQFLSPDVNVRNDDYGGNFENRIRLLLKVLSAVRKAINIPIIARISGDEIIQSGFHIDEMIKFSAILEENGVDAVHVSAGSACSTPPWFFQHMFIPKGKTWYYACRIKENVKVPVIFVGRINSIKDIKYIESIYNPDYLAVGRAMIADPDFVGKYLNKVEGLIRPCLACAEGCLGGVKSGHGLQCLVNPKVGKEIDIFEKPKKSKNFAVVGAGLTGMEVSLTLKKRRHKVTLFEKDELGGQFNFASLTPNKESMGTLIPYFVKEIKANNIKVIYKEAKKCDLINKYDEIVIASGSKPSEIKIDGLDKFYWAEILLKENLPNNKKVFIIGGGLIGVDIATALIPLNNQVIIVKRTSDFGEDMEMIAKSLSLKIMKEKGTIFSDHTHIKKVAGRTVYAERDGKDVQFSDIDMIVVSTGMKSFNPLEKELKNNILVHVIGDAKKIGNAQDAIHDAYKLAMSL
jgi:2,4-dienoyl-CoA reductase-like NADH-dependent reductase (Old Yellow Enzyme family)/thioredoxin reductase